MKKFLKQIISFSFIMLLAIISIELYLYIKPNAFSTKNRYLEENINAISILLMGSSFIENGLNPLLIGDSTFNFASGGRPMYYDVKLGEKYIPQMKKLKYVIWSVGYNQQFQNYNYVCLKKNNTYDSWYNLKSTFRCMYLKYNNIPYKEGILPYYYWFEIFHSKLDIIGRLKGKEDNLPKEINQNKGFQALNNRSDKWEMQQLPIIVDYNNPNALKAYNENLKAALQLAKVCKENNVQFIIVTPPCYKSFLDQTTPKGLNDLTQYITDIKNQYPDVIYLNYLKDSRFNEEDFFNSSHLSEKGANKWTKILCSDLIHTTKN